MTPSASTKCSTGLSYRSITNFTSSGGHGDRTRNPVKGNCFPSGLLTIRLSSVKWGRLDSNQRSLISSQLLYLFVSFVCGGYQRHPSSQSSKFSLSYFPIAETARFELATGVKPHLFSKQAPHPTGSFPFFLFVFLHLLQLLY